MGRNHPEEAKKFRKLGMPWGQIAVAAVGVLTAITGAFYSATVKVEDINTQVQVLKNTQGLQYTELKTELDRIEGKLDVISSYKGVTSK